MRFIEGGTDKAQSFGICKQVCRKMEAESNMNLGRGEL